MKKAKPEVAILDECAAWLASRSASIGRGFASKASTTGEARRKFHENIKKDA